MRAMFHKINNKYNYVTIIRLRVQSDKYIIIVGILWTIIFTEVSKFIVFWTIKINK